MQNYWKVTPTYPVKYTTYIYMYLWCSVYTSIIIICTYMYVHCQLRMRYLYNREINEILETEFHTVCTCTTVYTYIHVYTCIIHKIETDSTQYMYIYMYMYVYWRHQPYPCTYITAHLLNSNNTYIYTCIYI